MIWFALGLLALVAVGFVVSPFLRGKHSNSLLAAALVLFVVGSAALVYQHTGNPGVPSGASSGDPRDEIAALRTRLDRSPDDLETWKRLGRAYANIGDFEGAVNALDRAVALESAQNPQTLVELGFAMMQANGNTMTGRTISVFENAVALAPNNPEALFYSGLAAATRGATDVAANRWEALLATDPPAEVRGIIESKVAEWRAGTAGADQGGLSVSITVSDEARAALPQDATVFVIARDPAQPVPPIAVTRRRLAELPATISLNDGHSMIPGRELSGFARVELLARVSLSGEPTAQSGDWFGQVETATSGDVDLSIDQQVP